MKNTLSKPITLSMTIDLETSSDKNLAEQFGSVLPKLARGFVQQVASAWANECINHFLAEHDGHRLVHHSNRQVFTPLGSIELPNAEIRCGKKYVGKVSQKVFGLKKKQQVLLCAKDMIATVVTMLSFRKSARFLSLFWGETSHQHLHKAWKSMRSDVPLVLEVIRTLKTSFDRDRILAWLDGWVVKTRECKGAEVIRNTLRVAVAQFKVGNKLIWKATSGFLECSYQQLYRRIIEPKSDVKVILLCDGESSLVQGFTDHPGKKGHQVIDHDTGEVIESLIVVAGIQRCLFHLAWNIVGKARSEGIATKVAESLSENLKKVTYLSTWRMGKLGSDWKHVVAQRIAVLHWMCDDLTERHFPKTAQSIRRAIPHLFTYVHYFCQENFFVGRTTNTLENMFRQATYRVKRIGAIWSPKGAQQMLMFILARHLHSSLSLSSVKPLSFHIHPGVVKR